MCLCVRIKYHMNKIWIINRWMNWKWFQIIIIYYIYCTPFRTCWNGRRPEHAAGIIYCLLCGLRKSRDPPGLAGEQRWRLVRPDGWQFWVSINSFVLSHAGSATLGTPRSVSRPLNGLSWNLVQTDTPEEGILMTLVILWCLLHWHDETDIFFGVELLRVKYSETLKQKNSASVVVIL